MNISPVSFASSYVKKPGPSYSEQEFDEIVKRVKDNTLNPCYNNISNFVDTIDKTKANTRTLYDYYQGEIDYDAFLKQLSFNNICTTIASKYDYKGQTAQKAQIIQNSFEHGDEDASTFEEILGLVDENKLLSDVFIGLDTKAWFKDSFLDDVDKFYSARAQGQDLKEVFVPEFKNIDEAKDFLKTGEVCSISGDKNISIKLDNGEVEELFISPEVYLELFPPVEKEAMAQGKWGDCFFIA